MSSESAAQSNDAENTTMRGLTVADRTLLLAMRAWAHECPSNARDGE